MAGQTITPFLFEGKHLVRIASVNGAQWFVAADACKVLDIKNVSDAVSRLDEDEKGIGNADTLGGQQDSLLVSESGLYALIFRSRKPAAMRFRKWVTAEVLPSIRKTGGYTVAEGAAPEGDLSAEPIPVRLRLVEVAIRLWGEEVGREAYLSSGLPVVPGMLRQARQMDLFRDPAPADPGAGATAH